MKKIFKYTMKDCICTRLGAELLDIQFQQTDLVAWFLVDDTMPEDFRYFEVVGTGWDIDFRYDKYIKTLQDSTGFAWHIFEMFKEENE